MYEIERSLVNKIRDISREPWLHDPRLTDEERMVYKIKNVCHVCGIDPTYHRDDCEFSDVQLSFMQMEREHTVSMPLSSVAIGNIAKKLKYKE